VAVAVGHFTSSGKADLAVGNVGIYSWEDTGNLSILLGNGDGTFQGPETLLANTNINSVAVGDFRGDGRQDVVVDEGVGASVLLGNGDGSFQNPIPMTPGGFLSRCSRPT
jgi:hypothetical protein